MLINSFVCGKIEETKVRANFLFAQFHPLFCQKFAFLGQKRTGKTAGGIVCEAGMKSYFEIRHLTPAQKLKILERDAFICVYCNDPAECVDHIVPYSYFPNDDEDNLIASCNRCNAIAGDKVFSSLAEKSTYIRKMRSKKKSSQHIKITRAYCLDCEKLFKPRFDGSSSLLCKVCYAASKLEPWMRDHFRTLVSGGKTLQIARLQTLSAFSKKRGNR